jgi:hypothetical protein
MQITYTTLEDIFTQNCGYYIPNFQREYSWTKDPALKLIQDLEDSVRIKISDSNSHNFFLGSLILLRQTAATGVVIDNHRIANTVYTVIDGQQRITTLSILAAILQDSISEAMSELELLPENNDLKDRVYGELGIRENKLKNWQCFNVPNPQANPHEKPLIIRSLDAANLRAVDQWTLNGTPREYYQSDIAIFLQHRIENVLASDICSDLLPQRSQVRNVAEALLSYFRSPNLSFVFAQDNPKVARKALERLQTILDEEDYWALYESYIGELSRQGQKSLFRGIYLLLFCDVLMDRTLVVTLKPEDIALAYDMFQSINGTGVPLTTIEVIKPDLVQKFRNIYATNIQPKITAIENRLSSLASDPEKKALKTAEVLCDVARAYHGNTDLTKIFSAQRGFLKKVIEESEDRECLEFLDFIKNDLVYRSYFIRGSSGNVNQMRDQMRAHLVQLSVPFEDADLVTLIMLYLNASNHMYAHRVLSVFYSRLASIDPLNEDADQARTEFVRVAKSCAAFFTLWTGLGQQRHPDAVYKSLFTGVENITLKKEGGNQQASFVNRVFLDALDKISVTSLSRPFNKENWKSALIVNPIYNKKKAVSKFLLLLAHHDSQPEFGPDLAGRLRSGPNHCAPYLTTDGWLREPNQQIEHIAVQNPDQDPSLAHLIDQNIYEQDPLAIHRIGNLTFLSGRANPAIGKAPWPTKLFFYWSLTNRGANGAVSKEDLMNSLQIQSLPPSLPELAEGADFVNHLAPLVEYGLQHQTWTLEAIQKRGENLADRAFAILERWLT